MSAGNSKGTKRSREKDSLEMVRDLISLHSASGQRSLDVNIRPTEQQSHGADKSSRIQCQQVTDSDSSSSASKAPTFAMEENKLFSERGEKIQNIAAVVSRSTPSSEQEYEKSSSSNPSTPESNEDFFLNPASETEDEDEASSRIDTPPPFKDFPLNPSDLPFTKEKIAESLSLEEACGFLPYLMKTKRGDLKDVENQMDQVSVDLQLALLDAKKICILLENAPKGVPEDINAARVQAQKLMYLLSSSFRIFEKLERWGKALKEGINVYSKESEDYHSSVDVLLEYIMETILDKCKEIESNV